MKVLKFWMKIGLTGLQYYYIKNRVFVYKMVSSGSVAQEFQLRLMRLGLNVEAVADLQMIQMSVA
ncbi:MAG: hypothetical protein K0R31_794 [Clostridiales bacterium]|jgi:DNA-binding MurR/RpiR family transcriptional regulator|nr:hypothetical protein [Clostridiales bacterium]